MPTDTSRLIAVKIFSSLLSQQGSLSSLLETYNDQENRENKALIQALCFGLCRHYEQVVFIADSLLEKPLRKKDRDIYCLLLIGIYQLFFMRMPDYAVVNECVNTCKQLKKPWAKNLVNAVLRSTLREADTLQARIEESPQLKYSHPAWLIHQLQHDWPDNFPAILLANNRQAPMTLRVNLNKTSRTDYLDMLKASGITALPGALAPGALVLDEAVSVDSLPGFHEGLVSVQDEASQLAATLMQVENGETVLDACAAPGGKTGAMLELAPQASIYAVDKDKGRVERVNENLQRLGANAKLIVADIRDQALQWQTQGLLFDRILLDAPCSATGVIRRHPDIKLLRREEDIPRLVHLQAEILTSVWPLLKPSGRLLYSTCSVLPAENSEQIASFLSRNDDAREIELAGAWGLACRHGRQLLPKDESNDGFYYALLQKC